MRYFILLFLFFVFSLWGGEPEKANTPKVEAPKVEIPSNVKAFLDTYDRQMDVEKQKYLNLVLKFQKDLKVKLDNEIKVAEQKGKKELVVILTEKVKQLEENTVEDNFIALGFPGEVRRSTKKMLEDILSSTEWSTSGSEKQIFTFKKGTVNRKIMGKVLSEKNGKIIEKEQVVRDDWSTYLIDVDKSVVIFGIQGTNYTCIIAEKGLLNPENKEIHLSPNKK